MSITPQQRLRPLLRLSLTTKMLLLTLALGLGIWYILNTLQARSLHDAFMHDLSAQLQSEAEIDRRLFDAQIQGLANAAKLISTQHNFIRHIDAIDWNTHPPGTGPIVHVAIPPPWMPPTSILRAFYHARTAQLLDATGTAREVYFSTGGDSLASLPLALRNPSPVLRKLSHNQAYMTLLDGRPYVLAAQSFDFGGRNGSKGTLLLSAPIDDAFLRTSGLLRGSRTIMALLDMHGRHVVASSDPQRLPDGQELALVNDHYLMIGKSFFDYGASDLQLQFASFISTGRANHLTETVINLDSQQRAVLVIVLLIAFSLLTMWVALRVNRITRHVLDIGSALLGHLPHVTGRGDELDVLSAQFDGLIGEIIDSRDRLAREAEEKVELNRKMLESERRTKELQLAAAITENVLDGIVVTDVDGIILTTNPAMSSMSGYTAQEMQGHAVSLFNSQHHEPDFFVQMWHDLETQGQWEGELWNRRRDGTVYPSFVRINALRDGGHGTTGYIAVYADISEYKQREAHLADLAYHDPLTHLPNRQLFADRIEQALANAHRNRLKVALLFIDLDGFKEINDTFGHAAGDHLLIGVAERLRAALRETDTAARLGGDEFAVLLQDVRDPQAANEIAEKLLNQVNEPITLGGQVLQVGASIGIAHYPQSATDASELLAAADAAMYRAKEAGKNTICTMETPPRP